MLQIYNSLTRKKEIFKPIKDGHVSIYVCGMTVYDYSHIGHARMLVVFDFIVRYLRFRGYDVNYVRNITDIDDKIIKRANENNETIGSLTERFIIANQEDENALNILPPNQQPRATHHIPEIISMIETLIAKNVAYVGNNGDVFYSVNSFQDYGNLANKDTESLLIGARIDEDHAKNNPLDFVLWKMSKPEEPAWDSPWGKGRPGWHIECSAMSTHCLDNHFDIHGGGHDLKFPHHENEIAQSEAATGEKFVNIWMHNGFIQVNKEKMSKSLGNFFTIREVLAQYRAEVVRYVLVASHYRSPINYSQDSLDMAEAALERFYQSLRGIPRVELEDNIGLEYQERFIEAMDDDFNSPEALAVLFDLTKSINKVKDTDMAMASQLAARLYQLADTLGILQSDPEEFLKGAASDDEVSRVEQLIQARNQARQQKNWAEADKVRDQLTEMGIAIEDGPEGTSWRKI